MPGLRASCRASELRRPALRMDAAYFVPSSQPMRLRTALCLPFTLNTRSTQAQLAAGSFARCLSTKGKQGRKRGGKAARPRTAVREIRVPEICHAEHLATLLQQPVPRVMEVIGSADEAISSPLQPLGTELIELVAMEFGAIAQIVELDAHSRPLASEEERGSLSIRPPVVALMGHVDHGKTSLLDAFRGSAVAMGEAGGITQAISAFTIDEGTERAITFIDTPGHELFSAMRMRGATATDIVVLVVAVNAGVQPTTIQAIDYAREMELPVVVVANKIDRDGSDAALQRISGQLLSHGLQVEELGGEAPLVGVSAIKGTNLDLLREQLLLQAEMLELHTEHEGPAEGIVLEASTHKGLGVLASVLVRRGRLQLSDHLVVGTTYGRVRSIQGEHGRLKQALPSSAVLIAGLKEAPSAGDEFLVLPSEARAREVAEFRELKAQIEQGAIDKAPARVSRDAPSVPVVPAILKADCQGGLEALLEGAAHFPTDRVALKAVKAGIGSFTDSDLDLAHSIGAMLVGFNVSVPNKIRDHAQKLGLTIHSHKIIYEAIEALKVALEDAIPPLLEDVVLGTAEVRQIFTLTLTAKERKEGMFKKTNVAGSQVTSGEILVGAKVRVLRGEDVVFDGSPVSIKHFKEDIHKAKKGTECGIILSKFGEFQ
ncbi:MAG: hypothetical protein SGPRY_011109, partial [Prymnesium sp.]